MITEEGREGKEYDTEEVLEEEYWVLEFLQRTNTK